MFKKTDNKIDNFIKTKICEIRIELKLEEMKLGTQYMGLTVD